MRCYMATFGFTMNGEWSLLTSSFSLLFHQLWMHLENKSKLFTLYIIYDIFLSAEYFENTHSVIVIFLICANFSEGEFIDYYENLDGDDLPEDYKELYDYYNYYNEKV